jgi:hypothetical protein
MRTDVCLTASARYGRDRSDAPYTLTARANEAHLRFGKLSALPISVTAVGRARPSALASRAPVELVTDLHEEVANLTGRDDLPLTGR